MRKLLVVAALAGCSSSDSKVGAEKPDCDGVGATMAAHWAKRGAAATDDAGKAQAAKMGPIATERIVGHCKRDGWSAAATTCMKAGDFKACEDKLTTEQVDKLKSSAPPQQPPS